MANICPFDNDHKGIHARGLCMALIKKRDD